LREPARLPLSISLEKPCAIPLRLATSRCFKPRHLRSAFTRVRTRSSMALTSTGRRASESPCICATRASNMATSAASSAASSAARKSASHVSRLNFNALESSGDSFSHSWEKVALASARVG